MPARPSRTHETHVNRLTSFIVRKHQNTLSRHFFNHRRAGSVQAGGAVGGGGRKADRSVGMPALPHTVGCGAYTGMGRSTSRSVPVSPPPKQDPMCHSREHERDEPPMRTQGRTGGPRDVALDRDRVLAFAAAAARRLQQRWRQVQHQISAGAHNRDVRHRTRPHMTHRSPRVPLGTPANILRATTSLKKCTLEPVDSLM